MYFALDFPQTKYLRFSFDLNDEQMKPLKDKSIPLIFIISYLFTFQMAVGCLLLTLYTYCIYTIKTCHFFKPSILFQLKLKL